MATTYFVGTNGSDTFSGTELAAPFLTLKRAAEVMLPGDTCFIRGGIYRETLSPSRTGASDAPITFGAYSNEVVTISGADVVTSWKRVAEGLYAAEAGWSLGEGYNQVFFDQEMMHQARYPAFGVGDL